MSIKKIRGKKDILDYCVSYLEVFGEATAKIMDGYAVENRLVNKRISFSDKMIASRLKGDTRFNRTRNSRREGYTYSLKQEGGV